MMRTAVGIGLVPGSRKQEGAVEAGIKGAALIVRGAFDFDSIEVIVPYGGTRVAQLIDGTLADFVAKIERRLVEGDEGGRDARFQLEALGKAKDSDPVLTCLLYFKAVPRVFELQQIVGREGVWDAARVCG